jgi:hypothetical protein
LRTGLGISLVLNTAVYSVVICDIGGGQELLQKELDLVRGLSAISLERLRGIERERKASAFALVD